MDIRIEIPSSITEFADLVLELARSSERPLWFRGCQSSAFDLLPSLYRHPTEKDVAKLLIIEQRLLEVYRNRAMLFPSNLTSASATDWHWTFLMQHYRVPTRLVDWTENAFVALYFALQPRGKGDPAEDRVVWVLSPRRWNEGAMDFRVRTGGVLPFEDEDVAGYRPGTDVVSRWPIAIDGLHNSPRIITQRGAFVIYGREMLPMESVHGQLRLADWALAKLVFPAHHRNHDQLRTELQALGYTDSVIYPDHEGLALELRDRFGFSR